jgi:hypothetical protein
MGSLYESVSELDRAEKATAAMEAVQAHLQHRRAAAVARLKDINLRGTARRDEERAVEDIDDMLRQLDHGWGPLSPGRLREELAAVGVDIAAVQTLPWMRRRVEELRTKARSVRDAQARAEAAAQG